MSRDIMPIVPPHTAGPGCFCGPILNTDLGLNAYVHRVETTVRDTFTQRAIEELNWEQHMHGFEPVATARRAPKRR
jgi:hypothetical protein